MIQIIGMGGHSRIVTDIFRLQEIEVDGYYDDAENNDERSRIGSISNIKCNIPYVKIICAIGDNQIRWEITRDLAEYQLRWTKAIHPSAIIGSQVEIGEGSMISAGVILNPRVSVGRHCIINTGATVDHDSIISDGAHIAPGVTICGHVTIGERCLIGAGSTVIPRIKIREDVIIGAGSTVICDITESGTYVGTPVYRLST